MKTYFANLPTGTWFALVIAAVLLAYPVAAIVVPALVHALVPNVVRTVISFL